MLSQSHPIHQAVRPEPITTHEQAIAQAENTAREYFDIDDPEEICMMFETLRIPIFRIIYALEWFRRTPGNVTGEFPRSREEVRVATEWLTTLNDAVIDRTLTHLYHWQNDQEAKEILGEEEFRRIRKLALRDKDRAQLEKAGSEEDD